MPNPLVSILVPTRNRALQLETCLKWIQAQAYAPFEILISDNASEDQTEEVCRRAARSDPRIRYIRQTRNLGLYGNHNFLIEAGKGEFLCFFHDHDERDPRILNRYSEFLQHHPEVGVVCSDWDLMGEQGEPLGDRRYGIREVTPGLEFIDETMRSGRSSVASASVMIRRSALGDIRFNEQGPLGFGDFPVWFQIAERAAIGHIPEILWTWRQGKNVGSARTIESMARDYHENLSRYCDEHLARWPEHGPRVARWKRDIRRYLFWALAFEVGLYVRKNPQPPRPGDRPTLFEILGYRLDPETFRRTLDQMRTYRTGPLEKTAFLAILMLVQLKITQPLTWATRNRELFRKMLKLC